MAHVYHLTCTSRLPWIVELRPGRGYPVDFPWATTNIQGDRASKQTVSHNPIALLRGAAHAGARNLLVI